MLLTCHRSQHFRSLSLHTTDLTILEGWLRREPLTTVYELALERKLHGIIVKPGSTMERWAHLQVRLRQQVRARGQRLPNLHKRGAQAGQQVAQLPRALPLVRLQPAGRKVLARKGLQALSRAAESRLVSASNSTANTGEYQVVPSNSTFPGNVESRSRQQSATKLGGFPQSSRAAVLLVKATAEEHKRAPP